MFRRHEAAEAIRVEQQGRGRPLISAEFQGHRFVAVGDALHFSKKWKTFADFLFYYIQKLLGDEWFATEAKKAQGERHPLLEWYHAILELQKTANKSQDGVFNSPPTGALYAFLGTAYSLYLLKHNAELQDRIVRRLKDVPEFQGAYYELIVANVFIRAGFILELEDETFNLNKHCEFSARSPQSGVSYWVEAKSRSVAGILGKTDANGTRSKDATNRLTTHIREAFQKPAAGPRMIFVDLNAEASRDPANPDWFNKTLRRLQDSERNRRPEEAAYVFVTNLHFHRNLTEVTPNFVGFPFGYGIPDFMKEGEIRFSELYQQRQKHRDAHIVIESFRKYPQIPETFDGKPNTEYKGRSRIQIGETYHFKGAGFDEREIGTVSAVTVQEGDSSIAIVVVSPEGSPYVIKVSISEEELDEYRKYGYAYFGDPKGGAKKLTTPYELFECS